MSAKLYKKSQTKIHAITQITFIVIRVSPEHRFQSFKIGCFIRHSSLCAFSKQ